MRLYVDSERPLIRRIRNLIAAGVKYLAHALYPVDTDGAITIQGLDHSRRVFDITKGLIRRGYSDANIKLVLGGNAVRVVGGMWPA